MVNGVRVEDWAAKLAINASDDFTFFQNLKCLLQSCELDKISVVSM